MRVLMVRSVVRCYGCARVLKTMPQKKRGFCTKKCMVESRRYIKDMDRVER